ELGNIPWFEHLAIHEYRHVQQFNNFNRGLTRAFNVVLGQEGRALANAAAIPNWFFEGDAVHSETALTPQGRGRLPYFLSNYNSLWQASRNYRLSKLLNGSLKDFVPTHYHLGYLVVNYGYEQYGPEFWKKVTADAAAFKGMFYPFRKAIKNHSSKPYRQFMNEALSWYSKKISGENKVEAKARPVTNFYFPQSIGEDSLLYVKDSYRKLPAFYLRDKGVEKKIKLRNISSEDWISYRNGTIAYTTFNTNARWSLIDYSNITLLDIKTGRETQLTRQSKYFTPDISPSGKNIIAVSVNDSAETELHLLNVPDGNVVKRIPSNGKFFVHPRFIDEEHIVIGIRDRDASIALYEMNLSNEKLVQLTPATFNVLGYPSVKNDSMFFTAAYDGNDDVYVMSLRDKKLNQLTSGATGSYYATSTGDSLIWSQFTADGMRLRSAATKNLVWKGQMPLPVKQPSPVYPVAQVSSNILATPARTFPITKYRKGTGLFNFHSWRPYYEDPEFTFSLYGNNVLNTFSSRLFYRYNQNEQSHGVGFNADYAALFPVLTTGVEYTFNRHVSINTPLGTQAGLLNGYEVRAGYYIPLNFTGGNTLKYLNFGSSYNFTQQMPVGSTKEILQSFRSIYLHHFISWTQQLPRARQQIIPKFGYSFSGNYRHRLDETGSQTLGNAQIFLPSFRNHGIVVSGSYQSVDTNNLIFSNRFNNSRGYTDFYFPKMWRASANYHLPLVYPDWGVGGIMYIMRLRANFFYDLTRANRSAPSETFDFRSTGAELFFETKWWNQLPVTFGVRYSHLLDAERFGFRKHVFEFVIPMDLIPNQ
ncbi:MAG TPA: hypothetical protein VEZ55_00060, partial [Chitinophagaceae bacterium]|nr:hypothetical protein [Chitinophagaceae bacterium]